MWINYIFVIAFKGCGEELSTRLQYAFEKVETMINSSNKGSTGHSTNAGKQIQVGALRQKCTWGEGI